MANQKLARNSRDSVFQQNITNLSENSAESADVEETFLTKIEMEIEQMASTSSKIHFSTKILFFVICYLKVFI